MTLLDNLFIVLETHNSENGFISTIELNAAHIVYTGHFPGHPVTPGVIQMQVVHKLLEKYFGRNLQLMTISQCKFLKIINPVETARVVIHIQFHQAGQVLAVKARGENGTVIFFKIDSCYQFI